MARKRKELSADVEAQIVALMARGGTEVSISAALQAQGIEVSHATVGRRMRELRGKADAERATSMPPLPTEPEDVPEGVSASVYDYWIETAEQNARAAQARGDLDGFGKMARIASTLIALKKKAEPLPKANPNEHPDMIAMGERAAKELHKLIDKVVGVP